MLSYEKLRKIVTSQIFNKLQLKFYDTISIAICGMSNGLLGYILIYK